MTSLYLASGSPRRRELLTQIGVPFQTVSAAIDETPLPNESPVAYVERLAREKALAGRQQLPSALPGSADLALLQGVDQCRFVYHLAARGVHRFGGVFVQASCLGS